MTQGLKREPPVRLPNPSAQPFVAALKTARFYAVIFFWVTMVCVLAYVATFVLAEWVGLFDVSAAEPVKAAPAGPVSWLGIFESAAAAAAPESKSGASFFGLEATTKKASPPAESPQEPAEPSPATSQKSPPESVTEGKIVAERPTPPAPRTPVATRPKNRRAQYYHDLVAAVLPPLRIVGILASILLGVTLFVYLQITLLGRLAGIRSLTNAVFLLLVFWVTVMPWEDVFPGFQVSAFYHFSQLMEAHATRLTGSACGLPDTVLYYGRFFALPIASLLLLACSGIRFTAGYHESVVANE